VKGYSFARSMKKKRTGFYNLACVLALLAMCGAAFVGQAQTQTSCTVESKTQYYKDFLASYEGANTDQSKAFEAAQKYLSCPLDANDSEETLANLNLAVARLLTARDSSKEAIDYFIKAASYDSPVKTSPQTYADLGAAYENGPYSKKALDYKRRFEGKEETPDSLLFLENILQIVDRIIDAYGRAVMLSNPDLSKLATEYSTSYGREQSRPAGPSDWFQTVRAYYQFRHNGSDAGLKEFLAGILKEPLPSKPVPITLLPPKKK